MPNYNAASHLIVFPKISKNTPFRIKYIVICCSVHIYLLILTQNVKLPNLTAQR